MSREAKLDLGLAKNLVATGREEDEFRTVLGKTISTDDFYEGQVYRQTDTSHQVRYDSAVGEAGRGHLRVQGGGQDGLPAGCCLQGRDQHGDGGPGVRSSDPPCWYQDCCGVCHPAGQVERRPGEAHHLRGGLKKKVNGVLH